MGRQTNKYLKSYAALILLVLVIAWSIAGAVFSYAAPETNTEEQRVETEEAVIGGAYEVTEYKFHAVVNKDHSYEVEETISVNIPEQLQKIDFSIPSGNFRVTGLDVEDTLHTANIGSEASLVSINDADKLTPGTHEYTIKYTIREFLDRDGSYDIFYFSVLPPDWKQPIGKVDISAEFPKDFPWDDIQCYAGQFGVQDINNRVNFDADEDERSVTVTGEKIPENFGITLKADLPNGYWKGALDEAWVLYTMLGLIGGIPFLLFILWLIGGRDPKIEKVRQTKPIEGAEPHELGYIFNSKVTIRDVILLIIRFGMQGYLSITEYEPKQYKLYRRKSPDSEEKMYRTAYNILFEDIYEDRAVDMDQLGDRLRRVLDSIKDDIAAGYSSADSLSFTTLSRVFRMMGCVLWALGLGICTALTYSYEYLSINYIESIIVAVLAFIAVVSMCRLLDRRDSSSGEEFRLSELIIMLAVAGAIFYVTLAILRRTGMVLLAFVVALAALVSLLLIGIMRARGKDNAELVMKIRQLRSFIAHPTPRDVLENTLADDQYFYEMLQYALVFGAEESWAISFLTLNVPEPTWYSDEVEGHAFSNLREEFSVQDYAKDIKTFMRTIEAAFGDYQRRSRRR